MERSKRGNLDEGVSVLGSEVDGEHEAALRVERAEMPRGGVQKHARALAPDLAGARDELQRGVELREGGGGAEESASERDRAREHWWAIWISADQSRPVEGSRRSEARQRW